jgi:hypothetical protein
MKLAALVLGFFGVFAVIFGLGLLFTFPLMWAINFVFTPAVIMALFGVSQITFWKTFVLAVTMGWLFKSSSVSTNK